MFILITHTCMALCPNYMITIPTTCNHSIPCKILEGAEIYKFLTIFPSHLQAITYLCTICEDQIFNEIETFNPLSNEVKITEEMQITMRNSFGGSKSTRIHHSHDQYMNHCHHLGPSPQYIDHHYHHHYWILLC